MTVTIEGELIAPEDTADLERRLMGASALPLAEREALITTTLEQSAGLLSLVARATDPAGFAKAGRAAADMATEYAKRLDISKDIVLDAQCQQRHWERALGLAIREGQERGEIADRSSGARIGALKREAERRGEQVDADRIHLIPTATDFLRTGADTVQTYAVTDNVTDAEFEAALKTARDEGNVSRANVVRKIREAKGTAPAAEPTRTGDAKRAAKQVATFSRIINTLEANTMVIDELIRAGLDPAITDDEASRIVAGLEAFARAAARVKKSLI